MSRLAPLAVVAIALMSALPADAATFLFIRHAESTTNSGTAATPAEIIDPPLTALGAQQAQALVNTLAGYDLTRIYVSSYQRTALTIAPTAAARGLTPVVEDDIREWSFGDGTVPLDLTAIQAMFGQWLAGNTAAALPNVPGSESLDALNARVVPAYRAIFDAHKDEDGVIAIVGHGGSIGWTMPAFTGNVTLPFVLSNNLPNTGIVRVEVGFDGNPYVTNWNGRTVTAPVPSQVPLPATGWLLIAGIGLLAAGRRAG
jgi:probable phosphoglycerate mutase